MKKFLYPGSFDPLTTGHLDIIKRASKLCDQLVVGIVTNSSKKPMFTVDERKMLIKEAAKQEGLEVDVVDFSGLLADYARENQINTIVRGLRDIPDFVSEMHRAYTSKHLYEGYEVIYLLTDINHSYVSSSAIKEILYFNGDISGLVPENVLAYINENNIGGQVK